MSNVVGRFVQIRRWHHTMYTRIFIYLLLCGSVFGGGVKFHIFIMLFNIIMMTRLQVCNVHKTPCIEELNLRQKL